MASTSYRMKQLSIPSFFWQHIKPYKWFYLLMLQAPILGSFYQPLYNYSLKLFLDAMTTPVVFDYHNLILPITIFIGIQIVLEICWRVSAIAEWKAEPWVRRSILLNAYDYVQHHPYAYFQDHFTGAVSSKIKSILDGYDKFWAEFHHGMVHKLFLSVVNIAALLLINVKLGLFFVGWAMVVMLIVGRLSMRLNQLSFISTESRHALIGQIADKLTNIISIFSFASRGRELHTLDNQIKDDFIPKQINVYRYDFKIQLAGFVLYTIMFFFMLFYSIHLKITNQITVGDFAFIFVSMLVAAQALWDSILSLQDFSRAMGDLKSALSILQAPHAHRDALDAKPLVVNIPRIQLKQVCFGYQKNNLVFKDLWLEINPGEKVGLVGKSGAGKSTLANLLLRYFPVDSGEIIIDEQNINMVTEDSLRENIAVIPQDIMLFHRTLIENIRYGNPKASDEAVIEAAKKAHIHDFIMQLPLQYETQVGERGIKLSGGQRQRIAIARAILKDAPILMLDEATSSLDSHTEKLIQESLHFFIENKKKTMIAIAHRLSTLKHMDRIIVLDNGNIVEEGTHDALLQNPHSLYKKLWELQEI
jgi:ATP-binding cassette subfamily B protein